MFISVCLFSEFVADPTVLVSNVGSSDIIVIRFVSFLGWSETESTWYVGR
jgi:hypothetical protein